MTFKVRSGHVSGPCLSYAVDGSKTWFETTLQNRFAVRTALEAMDYRSAIQDFKESPETAKHYLDIVRFNSRHKLVPSLRRQVSEELSKIAHRI